MSLIASEVVIPKRPKLCRAHKSAFEPSAGREGCKGWLCLANKVPLCAVSWVSFR